MKRFVKKYYLCTIIIFAFMMTACDEVVDIQSIWPPAEVNIDGQSFDWDLRAFTTLMNKNIGVGIQNDSKNLYIIFALRNRMWTDLMQKNGVTLWIDNKGGVQPEFGLRYIGRIHIVEVEKDKGSRLPAINPPDKKTDYYFSIEDYMMAIDRVKNVQEKIMPDGSSGPAANFSMPSIYNPAYIYEFSIPLATGADSFGIGAIPGQTISIGLQWGGMDDATLQRIREMVAMGLDPSSISVPQTRLVWARIRLADKKEDNNR